MTTTCGTTGTPPPPGAREIHQKPWWRDRIRSAIASYWVYQHLGNLSPDELAADPDYSKIVGHGGDVWPLLVELADRADAEADGGKGVRFSFRWDLGHSRFLMIDSRNGRLLDDGQHLMLGDAEFDWIEQQVAAPGQVQHLVIGTSVPWLLPHAIGDLETVNEIAAARPGWRGRLGEAIRQGADLEHWSAFREVVRPAHRDDRTGRGQRPGHGERAVRRRAPQLRGPGRPAVPSGRPACTS